MKQWLLGIDIGGTRTKVGLVQTESMEVYASQVFPTEKQDRNLFFAHLHGAIAALCKTANIKASEISGTGIGIGSYVFRDDGTVDSTWGYIPCLDGISLEAEMQTRFGLSCIADNDLRLIALAESCLGSGIGFSRVLTVTLGTGVGVCLTENGRFVEQEAVTHLAGHIKVRGKDQWIDALDQEGCYCPVFGCMENTCSATALQKMAGELVQPGIQNEELFSLASSGDTKARACLDFFMECLICGLNQMVYIFSPDLIVLGGGITKALSPYLEKIRTGVTAQVHSRQTTEILISQLKENSGILGAALLWKSRNTSS